MRSRWPALAGLRPALLLLLLLLAASPEPTSTAPGRRWRGARHRRARNRDRAPVPIVQGAQASAAPAQTAVSLEAVQRLCACSPLSGKLRTYFKDVVLIVNTNYEFAVWATAPFWRRTFGRFFKHVLIMSPHGVKQLGVRARSSHKKWDFAYFDLPRIFQAHRSAAGFLWTNDDVAMNYWNLVKGNKSKLWWPINPSCYKGAYYPFDPKEPSPWRDWAGNAINRKRSHGAYEALPQKYKNQFDSSMGRKGYYPRGIADLFYIPQRYVPDFEVLIRVVGIQKRVPSEIALPMMLHCLEHPKDFDPILHDMVYLWDKGRYDTSAKWKPHVSALHPWKISNPVTRLKWAYTAGFYDTCLLHDALTGKV